MNKEDTILYSILLELQVQKVASLPLTTGPQIHAMFLRLLTRDDLVLFTQLHDVPGVRPFTLSQLLGAEIQRDHMKLVPGQAYAIRVTLMDEGLLWDRLSTQMLETGPVDVRIDQASLQLTRLVVNPTSDTTGWVAKTSWRALSESPVQHSVTLRFASLTAFNIDGKYYALFPEPLLVWESLLRVWNYYAPESFKMEKQAVRALVQQHVRVEACDHLATQTLHYQKYTQKGFRGLCCYEIDGEADSAQKLAALAEFARYAGVGYRTVWGMGQVRPVGQEKEHFRRELLREAQVC